MKITETTSSLFHFNHLIFLYFNAKGEEGFLRRRDRPELFKSNILGRLPPLGSKSDIVTDLK